MSEYQYYEFVALDDALDEKALEEVRRISSRAELTPTSFVNEYNFGSFKGDAWKMLEKYYDAMMYFANWGTREFMVSVPEEVIDVKLVRPYCVDGGPTMKVAGGEAIFCLDSSPDDGGDDDDPGTMASLLPIRNELIAGDVRSLYIGWLAGVASGTLDDDAEEPPVPPGLDKPTGAQLALAEFLLVDDDLLEVAAEASEKLADDKTEAAMKKWISSLPEKRKNEVLLALVRDNDAAAGAKLRNEFFAGRKGPQALKKSARTAGEIRARVEEL